MKQYQFAFDIRGLVLLLLVMLPNFIWFAVPAPKDILRAESVTPLLDAIASVCQFLFAAALCLVVNQERGAPELTRLIRGCIGCVLLYYAGWILYYLGITNPPVILLLTVPPCLAFLFFAADRKNIVAAVPTVIFTVCHLIYGIVNFMIC
ncbi:MAG: hypothetical protein HDT14_00310 [Oscillibacter sp.]|nr:hypothetical protein [Oscillibacter sp.]